MCVRVCFFKTLLGGNPNVETRRPFPQVLVRESVLLGADSEDHGDAARPEVSSTEQHVGAQRKTGLETSPDTRVAL